MSLTPQQQHQLLLETIEEALRLAKKFGLNNGVGRLEKFKESMNNSELQSLLDKTRNIEAQSKDPQHKILLESFFDAYQQRLVYFQRILSSVFGFDSTSETLDKELRKILYPKDKEIKKLNKENEGIFDIGFITNTMRTRFRNYIKHQFGVTLDVVRDGRKILENRLSINSPDSKTTVTSIARVIELAVHNDKPQNFTFNGIRVNGLYKLIKIISKIDNSELASNCVQFFNDSKGTNTLIMRAFFAAESTQQYCRNPSMLIQTLAVLVKQDHFCNELCEKFLDKVLDKKETNITAILAKKNSAEDFTEFLVNVVKLTTYFKPILEVARLDLENRTQKTAKLGVSQDILLRSAFYFGIVSPLLTILDDKLAKVWSPTDCQKFRLEFSTAIDLMLGLKPPHLMEKVKSMGAICPAFFDLATNELMLEIVGDAFASTEKKAKSIQQNASSSATPEQQLDKKVKTKQRRRSLVLDSDDGYTADKTTLGEEETDRFSLFAKKGSHIPPQVASSSIELGSSTKKTVVRQNYKKSRAVSFYHSTPSSSEGAKLVDKQAISAKRRYNINSPISVAPEASPIGEVQEFTMKASGKITPRKDEQKPHVKTFFDLPDTPDSTASDSTDNEGLRPK